jgi:hypothetical protein
MNLTNREVAALLWSTVFAAWALSVPSVRAGIGPVLRLMLSPAISTTLSLMLAYVGAIVFGLHRIGLWSLSDTKDTILWLIGFAFLGVFETPTISRTPGRLNAVAMEVFGLAVFIEFVVNLYVMPLWIELLLVPLLTVVGLMLVLADRHSEHVRTARFLRAVQSVVGLGVALFLLTQFARHFRELATLDTLRQFALPLALSLLFVPFLYCLAVYTAYDGAFRLLGWRIGDRVVRRYARRQTILACHVRIGTLNEWTRRVARTTFDSKESVDAAISKLRTDTAP